MGIKHDLYNDDCRRYYKRQVDDSRADMEPFQKKYHKYHEEFVGNDFGLKQRPIDEVQYVAMVRQITTTYLAMLVAGDPICRAESLVQENYMFAREFEANLNNLAKLIDARTTMKQVIFDSFFGLGIAKVGMGDATWIQFDDNVYSNGDFPFVARISLDDYVQDMQAKSNQKFRFQGDYYLVNEIDLRNPDLYDQKVVNKLLEKLEAVNQVGQDTETAAEMTRETRVESEVGYRQFKLLDLYIPSLKKLYTFDAEMKYPPLAEVDYSERVVGPYHTYGNDLVPDSTMYICLIDYIYELALVIDSLYRKMTNQAKDQKQVTGYTASGEKDAVRLKNAKNGEYIKLDDPEQLHQFGTPGPDQNVLGFTINFMNLAVEQGGNFNAMAGLGAQTKTVGQEQIIQSQLTGMVERLKLNVVVFYSGIYRGLAAELWDDGIGLKTTVNLADEGLPGLTLARDWIPGRRVGSLPQYRFYVEPNSLTYQTPVAKANSIINKVSTLFLPLSQTPMGVQSNMNINLQKLTRIIANLCNEPELNEIVEFGGRPAQDPPDTSEVDAKAMQPPRKYIHESGNKPQDNGSQDALSMMRKATDNNNSA